MVKVAMLISLSVLLSCSPTSSESAAVPLPRARSSPQSAPADAAVSVATGTPLDGSPDGEIPDAVAALGCPPDMVAVVGDYCAALQQHCLRPRKPWQCAEFEAPATCAGQQIPMRFCIDRYEYPNRVEALPAVMTSWLSAQQSCEGIGKRLCTEAEWTLACEGPERLAFPYGYVRDAEACAIDKRSPQVNEQRLFYSGTQQAELARLDQREPSGSRPRCVSAYGVFDLTGNVDEWVVNESGRPFRSSLKGGNWGEYRNACRPATRGHDERFYYYQTGFRCCRDGSR